MAALMIDYEALAAEAAKLQAEGDAMSECIEMHFRKSGRLKPEPSM